MGQHFISCEQAHEQTHNKLYTYKMALSHPNPNGAIACSFYEVQFKVM